MKSMKSAHKKPRILSSGPVTYRRKEYKTLHNEMGGEHDQEIHGRILNDVIQNRGDPW